MALVEGGSVDAPGRASADVTHVEGATLLGLPVELQKMILEYCSTNADKKNVCATSKRLQAVTTPLLYHHMELSSVQLTKRRFMRTLNSSHSVLPCVRVLSIQCLAKAQINILCRLIFALPKNTLTRFEHVYDYFLHYALTNAFHAIESRLATSPASEFIAFCALGRKASPTASTVVFTRVIKTKTTRLYGEPSHQEEMSLLT